MRSSGGLYAPTIRWHDGIFYVVCTLVGDPSSNDDTGPRTGNFVVTATDPTGPWSNPHWLGEPDSFDPSLLFDSGEAWFCATRPNPAATVRGGTEIWVQAFDVDTLSLTGPQQVIWHGALVDAVWAEAPHLYRVGESIVLVNAEGGTAQDHAVTCGRAGRVTGPYRNNPRNPILTHRHLGLRHPVVAAGHADLVQAADGTWWAVALAIRPRWADGESHLTLGRETFLAEVTWEDGWPVVNPGVGMLRDRQPVPQLPPAAWPAEPERDDFDRAELGPGWSYVRTPPSEGEIVSLTERPGALTLRPQPAGIADVGCPGFVCRPQDSWTFRAAALLDYTARPAGRRGSGAPAERGLLPPTAAHRRDGGRVVRVIRRFGGVDSVEAERVAPDGPVVLSVDGRDLDYLFAVNDVEIASVDGRALSTTAAGGFTGTMLGPYVFSGDLDGSAPSARFAWFEYRAED